MIHLKTNLFTIVLLQSLDSQGEGYLSNILRGMEWTFNNYQSQPNKRAIVNMSLGLVKSKTMNSAVAELTKAGMLVVVAAGNGDERGKAMDACKFSPSSAPEALTVGATDRNDGVTPWSNYGECVDILGPGERVRSLDYKNPSGSTEDSGTSFSAPYATGVGALAISANKNTTLPEDLKKLIIGVSTKNVIKGDLHKTPNRLVNNAIDSIPLALISSSGENKNHASWSIAGAVIFLSVWMWM
ncbi:peptidase S8/S53 domain-containing protein [Syncephalis fuscata]|nr:peptidase S8/S53 domain-containing protein [Syncephalis fuscata]